MAISGSFGGIYRGKRILVTGHTGFKGSWLSQWLLDLGAKLSGYSIDIPSTPSHFELLGLADRMEHNLGDVRDLAKVTEVFRKFQPEMVFHLAAQPIVRASYDDPAGTFATNVMGTVHVFEAIRKTPSVRVLINVTSDKCYENFEQPRGYRETDHLGGKDPYSASKGAAEIVFGAYARSFFSDGTAARVGSVRAGNVIGGGDWAADRIVPDCVRAWSKGEKVSVRNPKSIRPWQHVLEPLGGYLCFGANLWKSDAFSRQAFNFGPDETANQTVEALVGEMKKTWDKADWRQTESIDPGATGAKPNIKKEAGILLLDCAKAAKDLAWHPTLGFAESVRMTAQWYKDHYQDSASGSEKTAAQIREYEDLSRERGRRWAKN